MDRIPRRPDANLQQRLNNVDHHRNWHQRFYRKDLTSQQKAYEKSKIVISEIYNEADACGERVHFFRQRGLAIGQEYMQAEQFEQFLHGRGIAIPQALKDYKTERINSLKQLEKEKKEFQKDYMGFLERQYGKFHAIAEAERIANKEFWRGLFIATTKFLNDAGIKGGDELSKIVGNLLKSLIEGKI